MNFYEKACQICQFLQGKMMEEFSDEENENFIADSTCNNIQSPSFYRFVNQSHDPVEAVEDGDGSKLDRHDLQPGIFHTIKRKQVEFDDFDNNQEHANRFKKSLCLFEEMNLQNSFFEVILYGLLFRLSPDNKVCKDNAEKVLGENFFKEFSEKRTP